MLILTPPVPGPIVRPFAYAGSPFARGLHRGIDLRAAAGQGVVAPCGGAVAWAGPRGVTLVCSGRRVTLLPIAPRVRAGERVAPGTLVGAVVGGENLHLGVRRAGDPFGYVDPAPLLRRPRPSPPPLAPRGPRRVPARPAPPAVRAAPAPPGLRPAPAPPGLRAAPAPPDLRGAPLAPWPAWAGVAALLTGAAGGARLRVARTRRRRAVSVAGEPEPVP